MEVRWSRLVALRSQQLDPSGTTFATGTNPALLLTPGQPWEAGTVEAPDLVASWWTHLPFLLGQRLEQRDYGVGVATCTGPAGPCTDNSTSPILATGNGVAGPGGESIFTDATGDYFIAFHPLGARIRRLPEQPRPLHPPAQPVGLKPPGVGGPVG